MKKFILILLKVVAFTACDEMRMNERADLKDEINNLRYECSDSRAVEVDQPYRDLYVLRNLTHWDYENLDDNYYKWEEEFIAENAPEEDEDDYDENDYEEE